MVYILPETNQGKSVFRGFKELNIPGEVADKKEQQTPRKIIKKIEPEIEKNQPVLSESDEREIRASVGASKMELQRHKQNMDLLNRTFPGRLNDHIQFLKDLGISKMNSYFIDIGPGIADYHDQENKIRRDYPAITSLEMAKALRKNHTIALDLPMSVAELMEARIRDPKIGNEIL